MDDGIHDDAFDARRRRQQQQQQLECLANDLEQTKIEMKKKGATFIPNIIGRGSASSSESSSESKNGRNGGLNALAPSLAKPVSASREMFEKAKETLLVTGKTRMRSCIDDDENNTVGVFATAKIKGKEHLFEHSWREQRAPFGGMCMVTIEKLKFEYNVKDVYLELLKERFYSDGVKQAVPTSAQTFMKLAPEQFVRGFRGEEEDGANIAYDCIKDTYYATRDIEPGEEITIAKRNVYKSKPGSVAITCDSESVENELLSWLNEDECAPLRLRASKIHDIGVFLAADYSKPIEMPVSQLSELLQGHFRMAQCPHGWLTKEAPVKTRKANKNNDLDESMRNAIRERFGFNAANQTFPLQGGFHRVTFAQFLNHNSDNANVTRDRKKPVATYRFTRNQVGKKDDEITIDYRIDSATEDARDSPAIKVYYEWAIEKKSGPWDEIGQGAKERKGAVDYSKWDNIDTDSE